MGRQDERRSERLLRLAERAGRATKAIQDRLRRAAGGPEAGLLRHRYHILRARWERLSRPFRPRRWWPI